MICTEADGLTWCRSGFIDPDHGFAQTMDEYNLEDLTDTENYKDGLTKSNTHIDITTKKCKEVCNADYDCEGLLIRGYPKTDPEGSETDSHGCWLLKNVNTKGLVPSETKESILFELEFNDDANEVTKKETDEDASGTIINEVIMIKEVKGIPDLRHGQSISAPFGLDDHCMELVEGKAPGDAIQTCNGDPSCAWHHEQHSADITTGFARYGDVGYFSCNDRIVTGSCNEVGIDACESSKVQEGSVSRSCKWQDGSCQNDKTCAEEVAAEVAGSWSCRAKPLVDVEKQQCFCSNSGQTVFNPKMVVNVGIMNGDLLVTPSESNHYTDAPPGNKVTQFSSDFGNAPFYTQSWTDNHSQWLL